MFTLETKDWITLIGMLITIGVSAITLSVNLRTAKKTLFINTVTASRVKFMDAFRNNIADYCGTTLHILITDMTKSEERQLWEKLDKLSYLIKLQLNRHDTNDLKLIDLLKKIETLLDENMGQIQIEQEIENALDRLVALSQDFLKLEWEGIKEESKKGVLSEKIKTRIVGEHLTQYS